jgi:hypothetical protein
MEVYNLGLLHYYGPFIIIGAVSFFMGTYIYLTNEYGCLDDEDYYESRE